ncbi:MAG: hypothetical protein E6K42_00650, partial [Gammaproteobacteria bacterium]
MSTPASVTRRQVVMVSGAIGGALVLGVALRRLRAPAAGAGTGGRAAAAPGALNAYVRIEPSGRITFVMPKVEMGQGIQCWTPLRQAGATARLMLIEAAARRWRVPPGSCQAQRGVVLHSASGRRLSYGELATAAAALPQPPPPPLKAPKDFRLIGRATSRRDT